MHMVNTFLLSGLYCSVVRVLLVVFCDFAFMSPWSLFSFWICKTFWWGYDLGTGTCDKTEVGRSKSTLFVKQFTPMNISCGIQIYISVWSDELFCGIQIYISV